MGATGVGIGRPILYALAAYGPRGVRHCIDIFQKELVCDNSLQDIFLTSRNAGCLHADDGLYDS